VTGQNAPGAGAGTSYPDGQTARRLGIKKAPAPKAAGAKWEGRKHRPCIPLDRHTAIEQFTGDSGVRGLAAMPVTDHVVTVSGSAAYSGGLS
jgi:hypothetical protein